MFGGIVPGSLMNLFVDFHEEAFSSVQEALCGETEGQVKYLLDCRCTIGCEEMASREDLGRIADARLLKSFSGGRKKRNGSRF